MAAMNKSLLQELCAKKGWGTPKYSTTKQGPDHCPQFSATVFFNDVSFVSQGSFGSKKEAEASAAGVALEKYLGYQAQQPVTPKSKSLSSPVKIGCVNKVEGKQTGGDTNVTPKKKGADAVEQLLAQERMIWQKEMLELEQKNLELVNAVDLKSKEIQLFDFLGHSYLHRHVSHQEPTDEWEQQQQQPCHGIQRRRRALVSQHVGVDRPVSHDGQ